jgi:hypothetical protein
VPVADPPFRPLDLRVLEELERLLSGVRTMTGLGLGFRLGLGPLRRRGIATKARTKPAAARSPARTIRTGRSRLGEIRYVAAGNEMKSARHGFCPAVPVEPSAFAAANREYTSSTGQ